jgi:hypothetical protein
LTDRRADTVKVLTVGAVEFDTVIAASGLVAVIASVQRISMGRRTSRATSARVGR